MFISNLDFLSPEITLYHKGDSSHKSLISGIITIISSIIIFSFGFYFSLFLIKRKNPDFYYMNQYVEDAGEFPLNSSSIFHFIVMGNMSNDYLNREFDFRSFRLIGFDNYFINDLNKENLENYDHWLYGFCNNESDTNDIGYLIKDEKFNKFACIRKYYNSTDRNYYDTNDTNFKWPTLAHGNYNPNSTYYQVLLGKCEEKTLKIILGDEYNCKSEIEINKYFSKSWGFHFYFIENKIDITNYRNPNKKNLFRVDNNLSNTSYSLNNLNFFPGLVTTYNGLLFDNIKEEIFFIYDRNDEFMYPIDSSEVYIIYRFWLKNLLLSYERVYKKLQDIISEIGGISEIVTFLASLINGFYNNYIILKDTQKLLHSTTEEYEKNYIKKNYNNELKSNNQLNFDSSKSISSLRQNINKNKLFFNFKINNNNKRRNNTKPITYITTNNSALNINIHKSKSDKSIQNKENIKTINIENDIMERNYISNSLINNKSNLNLWDYLFYRITCRKHNKNNIKIYDDFRTKLISEENILLNQFNLFTLLKINENNLIYNKNKYLLKDIINYVLD